MPALDDADAFGVARIAEALELRELGVDRPIVVMSEVLDALISTSHVLRICNW